MLKTCLAIVVAVGGCIVGDPTDDGDNFDDEVDDGAGIDAHAQPKLAPSSDFNFAGVRHAIDRVKLNKANVQLYDGGFVPLAGLTVSNSPDVRMQGIEEVVTNKGTLYYSWGQNGYASGFIHVSDLARRPAIDPSAHAGNGKSCTIRKAANGDRKAYYVRPQAIPFGLEYRGPEDGLAHTFRNYGTPGAGYTYLSWSWVNKTGGGIVRSILQDGEVFYPCEVAAIRSTSIQEPGWVKVIYGMTYQGGREVFGWIVHSHQTGNDPPVMHLQCKNC